MWLCPWGDLSRAEGRNRCSGGEGGLGSWGVLWTTGRWGGLCQRRGLSGVGGRGSAGLVSGTRGARREQRAGRGQCVGAG